MDAKLERPSASQHAAVLAEEGDCGYLSWGCLWCPHGVHKDSTSYEYLLMFFIQALASGEAALRGPRAAGPNRSSLRPKVHSDSERHM